MDHHARNVFAFPELFPFASITMIRFERLNLQDDDDDFLSAEAPAQRRHRSFASWRLFFFNTLFPSFFSDM